METIVVRGKNKLIGSVKIPGAKNSVLPIMAAAIMCNGDVVLKNVPSLSDVKAAVQIIQELGCTAKLNGRSVLINADALQKSYVPEYLMQAMRSSLFFLAPLLVRTGRAEISQPGGCKLGLRPIDIHLDGLRALGATIDYEDKNGKIIVKSPKGLKGIEYNLRFPSVGATETLVMAAISAKGRTVLRGVAKEPEVVDLIRFLQGAGAKISGAGTDVLYIDGNAKLRGATHNICPDRITTATIMCAVAGCGGEVLLLDCVPSNVEALTTVLQKLGCEFSFFGNTSMCIKSNGPTVGIGKVFTDIYPSLSTDAAPLLMAACLCAKGESVCLDTIFENRFTCAEDFNALGAMAKRENSAVCINGVTNLKGASLCAKDLRGGAALVIAALQSEGESVIEGIEHIYRGYENIVELFESLGADIKLKN